MATSTYNEEDSNFYLRTIRCFSKVQKLEPQLEDDGRAPDAVGLFFGQPEDVVDSRGQGGREADEGHGGRRGWSEDGVKQRSYLKKKKMGKYYKRGLMNLEHFVLG